MIKLLNPLFPVGKHHSKLLLIMKLNVIFLVLCTFQISAISYSQDARVDLKMEDATLADIFNEIEAQSEYRIFYRVNDLDLSKQYSIYFNNSTAKDILENVLTGSGSSFKCIDKIIVIAKSLNEQEIIVKGKITDMDGNPLPGVNIVEKGTTNGAVTNLDGEYAISLISAESVLSFSFVGYLSEEIEVAGKTNIDLTMIEDIQSLEEVIVVGYGVQKKVNLTGSVSSISSEKMTQRPALRADQILQGLASGVTVSEFSGSPGSAPTVTIRGLGTLGNNAPLVIIDGVPGSFDMIDPGSIESISVLKDAASAAIYGSRAAGGVVLITTKRGEKNGIKVSYDGFAGIQSPIDLPEYLGAADYLKYYNEALKNETGADQNFQPINPNNDTDWVKETLKKGAVRQQHVLSFSGGTENIRSNVSLTYQNQEGIIANSNFERFSLRANNDFIASQRLKFSFDISAKRDIDEEPGISEGSVFGEMRRIPPIYSAINFDGTYGEGWNGGNPVAYAEATGLQKRTSDMIFFNLGGNLDIAKGLNLSVTFSPILENSRNNNFYKPFEYRTYDGDNNLLTVAMNTNNAELYENSAQRMSVTSKALLTYSKSFGENNFDMLAGTELVNQKTEFTSAERTGFVLPEFSVLDAGDAGNSILSGSNYENALLSYFGRVNYNYKNKYLIEFNGRYDGSSRFSKDNRWGFFPSVSVGWRLTEEEFFNVGLLDNLKLRGSWGQLGNQFVKGNNSTLTNASYFPYLSMFEIDGIAIIDNEINSAGAITTVANNNLSWETTTMVDVGLEISAWERRLTATFDYYVKRTVDILLDKPISLTIGLDPAPINAGEVENKGWELSLTYRNDIGDFGYHISGFLSDVKNEIVSLDEGTIINGLQIQKEGEEINSFFGYKTDGLLSENEIDGEGKYMGLSVKPGDIKYVDVSGPIGIADGLITDDDRVIIGSRIPRMTYSLDLGFDYKNFDFRLFLQGVGKVDGYLTGDAAWAFNNTSGKITKWQAENRWDPENPDPNAKHPRLWQNSSNINMRYSDFWVQNASFLKVKNIVIGYNIASQSLSNLGLSRLRLYVSGQNVLNFDKMEGIDAEAPLGGSYYYPQLAVYAFGINATF